ncbi:S-layer homology domain-containing protein [Sporosarcina sp. FSL K6-1522]|uniref:S-layer homology domain-containing protein n=1 Tax=Sporosarcina sp. FSL K6-1522 TaxID=2921554 RepID=UPI00315ADDBC
MKKVLMALILLLALFIGPMQEQSVEAASKSFKDVTNTHPNKKEIDYLVEMNIIKGYPDGSFRPGNTVTNGQAAIMVARALKLNLNGRPNPNFSDVFSTTSGFKEIAALVDEKIIPKEQKFNPSSPISRETMARMLVNAFKLEGVHHVNFSDVPPNYWAYSYITKLAANQVTTGYADGTFGPKTAVTRGHFSAFIARALNPAYKPGKSIVRGVNFDMTVRQVEKMESARLLGKESEANITVLTYETVRFGYYAHLNYYFEDGKLLYILYDFLPDQDDYNTWEEMTYMHDALHVEAVKELGDDYFYHSDNYSSIIANWEKDHYSALLLVDDEDYYTAARLLYYKNTFTLHETLADFSSIE